MTQDEVRADAPAGQAREGTEICRGQPSHQSRWNENWSALEADLTALELNDLWHHTISRYARVLNGINLEVDRGETVAVLGRSGGGKSVLLKTRRHT